jgi:hypothetical protein
MLIVLEKKDAKRIVECWNKLFDKICVGGVEIKRPFDKISDEIDDLNAFVQHLVDEYGISLKFNKK